MSTFSIIIATHGDESWRELAWSRAWPSACNQGAEVLIDHVPDATRAQVRNRLIREATGDYIITLDADDELAPGYVKAMEEAPEKHGLFSVRNGYAPALLNPKVSYVRNGKKYAPKFLPVVGIENGNWMVVGTGFSRDLFLEVGGWRSFYRSGVLNEWDDWDLWMRMIQAGAKVVDVPEAVYVAHVRNSPHHSRTRAMTQAWLEEIRTANGIGGRHVQRLESVAAAGGGRRSARGLLGVDEGRSSGGGRAARAAEDGHEGRAHRAAVRMNACWVDAGNDPNYALFAKYGITVPFFDPRDPRVTAAYLDSVAAHPQITTCGIYTAWNWKPEFSDPNVYAEWTDSELKRIGWMGNAIVCLDIEKGNGVSDANFASYTIQALTRWRQLRKSRSTWLTVEGMQGGLFTKALCDTIIRRGIRMAPQFFTGNMTPHRHSCVIDLEIPGVPAPIIDGMYDAALLPLRWRGFAFTQGRLPQ